MTPGDLIQILLAATLLVLVVGAIDLVRNPPVRLLRLLEERARGPRPDPPEPAADDAPAEEAAPGEGADDADGVGEEGDDAPADPDGGEEPGAARTFELLREGRLEEGLAELRRQVAIACETAPGHAAHLLALERSVARAAGLPEEPVDPAEAARAGATLFGVQLWVGLSAAGSGEAAPALRGAAELAATDAARTLAVSALVRELWSGGDPAGALEALETHARTLRDPQALARTFALAAETLLRMEPRDYQRAFALFDRTLRETPPDRSFRFEGAARYLDPRDNPAALFTAEEEPDAPESGYYPQRARYYRDEVLNTRALANLALALARAGLLAERQGEVRAQRAAARGYRLAFVEALHSPPPDAGALAGEYAGAPRGLRMEATAYGSVRGSFIHRDGKTARFSGLVEGGALLFLWSTNPNSIDSAYLGGSHHARSGHGLLVAGPEGLRGYSVEDDRGFDPARVEGWTEWRVRREE